MRGLFRAGTDGVIVGEPAVGVAQRAQVSAKIAAAKAKAAKKKTTKKKKKTASKKAAAKKDEGE